MATKLKIEKRGDEILIVHCCFSVSSPCTLVSSTTKTGCHDIAEILLKVVLNTKNQIKSNLFFIVQLFDLKIVKNQSLNFIL
jgi:hypothetical protein